MADTGLLGQQGVNLVEGLSLDAGVIFRAQPVLDHGIDGHFEVMNTSNASGRLVAVQIKAGPSYFRRKTKAGWSHAISQRHRDYWAQHSLPVVVILVDLESRSAYWQEATPSLMQSAGKAFKLEIPVHQRLTDSWDAIKQIGVEDQPKKFTDLDLDSLPPSVQRRLRALEEGDRRTAYRLVSLLANSLKSAGAIVDGVVDDPPHWLRPQALAAQSVIADFAEGHGLGRQAATLHENVGAQGRDSEHMAGRTRAATLHLLSSPEKASKLLRSVPEGPSDTAWLKVLRKLAVEPVSSYPRIAQEARETTAHPREPQLEAFIAQSALERQEWTTAVDASTRILTADSDNTGATLLLAQALIQRSRGRHANPEDLSRAYRLLKDALAQRRRWGGPTSPYLELFARVALMLGRDEQALHACAVPPHGVAQAEEAARPGVAEAALVAAHGLQRHDLTENILRAVPDAKTRDRLSVMFSLRRKSSPADTATFWRASLHDAVKVDDFLGAIEALQNLAWEGIDETSAVAGMAGAAQNEHELVLLRAQADAMGKKPNAITTLRRMATQQLTAAHLLTITHLRHGDYEQAVASAQDAATTFSTLELVGEEVAALRRLDRISEATDVAKRGLAASDLPPMTRPVLLRALGEMMSKQGEWGESERQFQELTQGPAATPIDFWNLVIVRINAGKVQAAWDVIAQVRLEPVSEPDAQIWLRAAAGGVWEWRDWQVAVELSERFHPSPVTPLLTLQAFDRSGDFDDGLLSEVAGGVTKSWRERIQALIARDASEAPGATLRVFKNDINDLVAFLRSTLEARDHRIQELLLDVRKLLPTGILALELNRSYCTVLLEKPLGYFRAGTANDDAHALEVGAALEALNGRVVVDASAFVFNRDAPTDDHPSALFASLTCSPSTSLDFLQTAVDCERWSRSTGSIGWSAAAGSPWLVEFDEGGREELLDRATFFRGLHANAAVDRQPFSHDALNLILDDDDDDDDDDLSENDGRTRAEDVLRRDVPWIDAVDLALSRGLSLWSDDEGQRHFAKSLGVAAFGTPALLEADAAREMLADPERAVARGQKLQEAKLGLIARGAVGIPVSGAELMNLGAAGNWADPFVANIVARPEWWTQQANPFSLMREIFEAAAGASAEALALWERRAYEGVGLVTMAGAQTGGTSIAALMILSWDASSGGERVREIVDRGVAIANVLTLPNPEESLDLASSLLERHGIPSAHAVGFGAARLALSAKSPA